MADIEATYVEGMKRTTEMEKEGNTTTEFALEEQEDFSPTHQCDVLQGYDETQWSSFENGSASYQGDGHYDSTQDYSFEERPQRGGFQNRKRHVASEPSPHVIFLGLDPDFTEADVCLLFMSASEFS